MTGIDGSYAVDPAPRFILDFTLFRLSGAKAPRPVQIRRRPVSKLAPIFAFCRVNSHEGESS
jgi:hypothetical protein